MVSGAAYYICAEHLGGLDVQIGCGQGDVQTVQHKPQLGILGFDVHAFNYTMVQRFLTGTEMFPCGACRAPTPRKIQTAFAQSKGPGRNLRATHVISKRQVVPNSRVYERGAPS